jgi:beta-phosphoglucomutase
MKAILFDLDGVLVDTERISTEASNLVLSRHGIIQTPEERRNVFGKRTKDNYREAINARGLDLDPKTLVVEKNQLFKDMIKGVVEPMPGVLRLLGELKEHGIKVAVVSSSPLERVNATLEEAGLFLEFDFIVSGDCCLKGKPNPEPFLLACERFGLNAGDCIVIEDAQAGIEAAKAAGMKVLGLRSPNTHGQDLSKADRIESSLERVDVDLLRSI